MKQNIVYVLEKISQELVFVKRAGYHTLWLSFPDISTGDTACVKTWVCFDNIREGTMGTLKYPYSFFSHNAQSY